MKEYKGTKGKYFINYISGIPIGVNAELSTGDNGEFVYSKNVVEPILPDTDEEWESEKEETTANLELIVEAGNIRQKIDFSLTELLEQYNKLKEENGRLKEIAKCIIDYPAEDLQSWIDYGQPVTITIPIKMFEIALSTLENTKN